jgi:hypothetical protein
MDLDVLRLTAALGNLTARRHIADLELQRLRAAISPLRRVPSEILAEIFNFCVENGRKVFSYALNDPREGPILITHVSSFWRETALATPRL